MVSPLRSLYCAAALATILSGCGATPSSGSAGAPATPRLTGSLTVFAAASLTEALSDDQSRLAVGNPGLSVTYSFAGSQQLVSQIQAGAPADVVATADALSMGKLVAAKLVETPQVFARNRLQIVVGTGNPRGVKGLADLARSDLRLVLADPSVPAGNYGRQALDRLGVTVHPVSLELSVKAELQKVESGEADAGIVYVTDVKSAGARVTGIAIPANQNVEAAYPVAIVKGTPSRELSLAFVDQLVGGVGQQALRARGFLPP
jgi:molybdate transport system substrate-binding protein